jgi:hypothetical protein
MSFSMEKTSGRNIVAELAKRNSNNKAAETAA